MPNVTKDIGKQTVSNFILQAIVSAYEHLAHLTRNVWLEMPHIHTQEVRQVASSIKAASSAFMEDVLKARTWQI